MGKEKEVLLPTGQQMGEGMKKFITLKSAILLVIFVFCSCNKSDSSKNNASPGIRTDNVNVTISTISMHGGTDAKASIYQDIVSNFMNEYDYITVDDNSQVSSQNWKTTIAADFAVGNEPDVIQFFTDMNANDVLATNKFVTIEEIRAVYPDYAKDIFPSALAAAANLDGVQRAVPTTSYWEGMFCNKDLFDQYGLELPTTWDKLITAIETFRTHNIIPIAVSLNSVPHYWIEFSILYTAGVESYNSVPETAPADWVRGIELIKTLNDMGAFPKDTDTIDVAFAENLFNEKKAAMTLDGSWFLMKVIDQDNTVVCSFPTLPDGKTSTGAIVSGISNGFYITRKAWDNPEKRDAAVKFIMAHTNKDAIRSYCDGIEYMISDLEPLQNMTPLALSSVEYCNLATSNSASTDARILPEAYNRFIKGIVDVVFNDKPAESLINEVLEINSKQIKYK